MEDDDTVTGGEDLSVEQAATAYAKATAKGTEDGQPEADDQDTGEQADDELQESGEDESEDGGEPEDEGQADDEDETEPESGQGRFVAANGKVRLPDGTVLTVGELINGNLKDRDYRQKTTQVSEERRALEQRSSALQASEKQVNEQREFISHLLQAITPQPPDPQLINTDFIAYETQKVQYEQLMGLQNQIRSQMQESSQKMTQQTAAQRNELANSEWQKLQEKVPELRDNAKVQPFVDNLQKAASAYGFTRDELAASLPYDHRFALVLRDAEKWRNLQANKPKAVQQVKGRPPVQKSGKRLSPNARQAQGAQDAVKRLQQSGSVEDAAAAYLASRKGP